MGQHVGMSVGCIVLFTLIEVGRLVHVGVTLPCLGHGLYKDREGGLDTRKHTCASSLLSALECGLRVPALTSLQ